MYCISCLQHWIYVFWYRTLPLCSKPGRPLRRFSAMRCNPTAPQAVAMTTSPQGAATGVEAWLTAAPPPDAPAAEQSSQRSAASACMYAGWPADSGCSICKNCLTRRCCKYCQTRVCARWACWRPLTERRIGTCTKCMNGVAAWNDQARLAAAGVLSWSERRDYDVSVWHWGSYPY